MADHIPGLWTRCMPSELGSGLREIMSPTPIEVLSLDTLIFYKRILTMNVEYIPLYDSKCRSHLFAGPCIKFQLQSRLRGMNCVELDL